MSHGEDPQELSSATRPTEKKEKEEKGDRGRREGKKKKKEKEGRRAKTAVAGAEKEGKAFRSFLRARRVAPHRRHAAPCHAEPSRVELEPRRG